LQQPLRANCRTGSTCSGLIFHLMGRPPFVISGSNKAVGTNPGGLFAALYLDNTSKSRFSMESRNKVKSKSATTRNR